MRSDEIRKEALSLYSHANVRDRYDADLMMAGFSDGAEWADAHPGPQGEPSDTDAILSDLVVRLNNEAYGKDDVTWGQVMRRIEGVEAARAALRAASVTKQGESREEQNHG